MGSENGWRAVCENCPDEPEVGDYGERIPGFWYEAPTRMPVQAVARFHEIVTGHTMPVSYFVRWTFYNPEIHQAFWDLIEGVKLDG